MSALATSSIIFACVFGGAVLGMLLRAALPGSHLNADSKDVVKLGTGLVGTMAALLLGLLVASAKGSYDTEKGEIVQMSAKIAFLDRILANYGSEANDARGLLREVVASAIDRIWPPESAQAAELTPSTSVADQLYKAIQRLPAESEAQRALKANALTITTDLGQIRWLLFAQRDSSISVPLLIVVVFWLSLIFVSFGLFAPSNPTVVASLLLCALSVSGAIFLVLELDQPFNGVIHISSAPMRHALEHLGRS